MAQVWLADYECRPRSKADDLPDVCLVCGEDATDTVHRAFRWHPSWVLVFVLFGVLGIIIFLVLAVVLGKSMSVDCPVCDRHRSHWRSGRLVTALLVVGGFGLMGVVIAAGVALRPPGQDYPVWAILGSIVALLSGLIAAAVVSNRLVRPLKITDDDIQLTNVSEEFVAAVKDKRRAARKADRDD